MPCKNCGKETGMPFHTCLGTIKISELPLVKPLVKSELVTLDELCGNPPGTFAQFLKDNPDPDRLVLEDKFADQSENPSPEFHPLLSGAECTVSATSENSGTGGEVELDDPAAKTNHATEPTLEATAKLVAERIRWAVQNGAEDWWLDSAVRLEAALNGPCPTATPETDKHYGVRPCAPGEVGTDDVEFARKLECERNAARTKARSHKLEMDELRMSYRTERDASRAELEENQRKNNVAMDILNAAVAELRKERDEARAELRSARHVLGVEYDIEERTVAESIGLLKRDWQSERSRGTKQLVEAMELAAELDALKNSTGATIADGGEWTREEAILMHRRKAEELLRVMVQRDDYHRKACDVADQRDALRAERDNLWQHRDAMQIEIEKLTAERDALKAAQQKSLDGFAALTAERDEALAARDALKAELAALGSACDKLRINENVMRRERDEAITTLHGSAMEMCGSSAFVKLYQETVRERDILRTLLTTDKDAAKRNVAKIATEKIIEASGEELLARIEELENTNAAGSAGFESLRAEWEAVKKERDAARRRACELQESLDEAFREKAEMSPFYNAVASQCGDLEAELEALKIDYSSVVQKVAVLRAALEIAPEEHIPAQKPTAGSLLVERGSIRRRISPTADEAIRLAQAISWLLEVMREAREMPVAFNSDGDVTFRKYLLDASEAVHKKFGI
jgi:chromosome segregation ATPase